MTSVRGELSHIIRIIDNYLFIILLSGIIDNLATNYHSLTWLLFPDAVVRPVLSPSFGNTTITAMTMPFA